MSVPVHTHTIPQHCTGNLGVPIHTTALSHPAQRVWAHLITAPPCVGKGRPVYTPALSNLGHTTGVGMPGCLAATAKRCHVVA